VEVVISTFRVAEVQLRNVLLSVSVILQNTLSCFRNI